jgi:hypothetical protein
LQRVENDPANALVLDAIGRTFPQVDEIGEPFVPDQLEEREVTGNRPAIGPERWREQQCSVNLPLTIGREVQSKQYPHGESADDHHVAPFLQCIVRFLDGLVPIHPCRRIQKLVGSTVADEKRAINGMAGTIEGFGHEFQLDRSAT